MAFHVSALPHTITGDPRFSSCAFTGIIERFARSMSARGHRVIHYGNEGSRLGENVEHVEVFSAQTQEALFSDTPWWPTNIRAFPWSEESFAAWNRIAKTQIAQRAAPGDFVCIIGGRLQKEFADIPGVLGVEYSVGYDPKGMFSESRRAFVSYAWMHYAYGVTGQCGGDFADAVIYPPVDPGDFEFRPKKDDYLLFLGQAMPTKGLGIAVYTARDTGMRLVVAGAGDRGSEPWVDYRGPVGPAERRELLAGARALICPTTYVEPFGLVAVEAMMSGTPVITTDWGAFSETVREGSGFRCRTPKEFVLAAKRAGVLNPHTIRARGMEMCEPERVAERYERWFARLKETS